MLKKIFIVFIVLVSISYADDLFTVEITNSTNGESFSIGFSTVSDTFDQLDVDKIKEQINYNDTDKLDAKIGFRGLPVNLSFGAGGTTLILDIPDIGVHEEFTGATRDKSVDAMTDWLKNNGSKAVEDMMKKLAEVSPVDPLAGNPNSLMATTVASDFDTGFTNTATKLSSPISSSASQQTNDIVIAASYNNIEVDGKNSKNYTLPLSYVINFDRNRDEKIIFSIPITYTEVEGAKGASLGLKVGYQRPITKDWTLTPTIGYSATGSVDLGTVAQLASGSLTSCYNFHPTDSLTLSMGNMVGYYGTVKFYDGQYAYDPGISNTVFRNALMVNVPTDALMNHTSIEVFVIDTRYTGTKLYIDTYQEYGVAYGFDQISEELLPDNLKTVSKNSFKVGFTYLNANKANGFKINMGYVF